MRIKLLLFIMFFSFISTKLLAKPLCTAFYERLENEYSTLFLEDNPISEFESYGFDLQLYYDENGARIYNPGDSKYKKDDYAKSDELALINRELLMSGKKKIEYSEGIWEIERSKEGYFKIGKVLTQQLAELVKPGDLIISANGKDLRDLDLSRKKHKDDVKYDSIKQIHDFLNEEEEVEFIFQGFDSNKKKHTKKIQLKFEKKEYEEPYLDFYIEAVTINEKEGTTDITIHTDFMIELGDNFLITKIAKEELVYKDNNGKDWFEECNYSKKDWEKLDIHNPNYGIIFDNLISKDQSRFEDKFFIFPSMVGTWDYITEDNLQIFFISKGEYKFKNVFRLHSFPFDRQEIKVFLYQSRYDLGEYQALVSDYVIKRLAAFAKKENAIQGWNIVDYDADYKVNKDPNYDNYSDGVEVTITIERKSSYYLFKVIFPIFLILMICWSAVWINPKEIESRLTITIVCLLSLIAYNFVIDSDMPKLEYLTIMDYIILISYVYAAIPNFLSIYSFKLIKTNKALAEKYEYYEKKYGLPSYIVIVFLIIIMNATAAPDHTNSMFTWASIR